jgi:hypothetical protein
MEREKGSRSVKEANLSHRSNRLRGGRGRGRDKEA